MNKFGKAAEHLTDTFIQSVQEGGGSPVEADSNLNDASRNVIRTMHEACGSVWLGRINIYKYDQNLPVIRKWDEGLVYNFGADFVIPQFDEALEKHLRDWNEKGASAQLYDTIYDRVAELGGKMLHWS